MLFHILPSCLLPYSLWDQSKEALRARSLLQPSSEWRRRLMGPWCKRSQTWPDGGVRGQSSHKSSSSSIGHCCSSNGDQFMVTLLKWVYSLPCLAGCDTVILSVCVFLSMMYLLIPWDIFLCVYKIAQQCCRWSCHALIQIHWSVQ